MEVTGQITFIAQQQSGMSQNGNNWVKQEFVITTLDAQHPKQIAFSLFGQERIQQANLQGGAIVKVRFDIDSHEHNGRYYTQLTAWSVAPFQATQAPTQQPVQQGYAPQQQQQMFPPTQQPAQGYYPQGGQYNNAPQGSNLAF